MSVPCIWGNGAKYSSLFRGDIIMISLILKWVIQTNHPEELGTRQEEFLYEPEGSLRFAEKSDTHTHIQEINFLK